MYQRSTNYSPFSGQIRTGSYAKSLTILVVTIYGISVTMEIDTR